MDTTGHRVRICVAFLLTGMAFTHANADVPAGAPSPSAPAVDTKRDAPTGRLLTLPEALDAAAAANIDLLSVRNARALAAADVRTAAVRPNPVLSLGATQIRRANTNLSNTADDVVRIDQPIELGGKRSLRVAAARAGLAAADQDINDTGRQVRATVVGAFYDLLAAQYRLVAQQEIADNYTRSFALAERRAAAGDISSGELARQRVETVRARTDLAVQQAALSAARTTLAILIGRDADAAALVAGGGWPDAPSASTDDADSLADRRADVRAADLRVEQARQALAGARKLRVPDISIGAQYEYQAQPVGVGSSVGLGVAVPLPVFNNYGGQIDAANAQLTQAESLAAKTRSIAVAEIMASRSEAATAVARRVQFDAELLPAARQAAQTAEFAYRRGALALTDLLDARRGLAAAELGAIDAHADEARALARLAAAEGDQ